MRTSTVRRLWMPWLDHCFAGDYIDQHFFGKTIGGVPTPWADAIRALESVLRVHGWIPRSAWAYNFRGIAGKPCSCSSYLSCSLHGSGVAIDIDPNLNPQSAGPPFIPGSFPPELIRDVEAIRNMFGDQVFTWGGWWSIPDRMHFQARVGPARAKVNWDTVKQQPEEQGDEIMPFLPMQIGDGFESDEWGDRKAKRSDVAIVQSKLNTAFGEAAGYAPIAEDGAYGTVTAETIARWVPGGTEQGDTGVPGGFLTGKAYENLETLWAGAIADEAIADAIGSIPEIPELPNLPDFDLFVQWGDTVETQTETSFVILKGDTDE